MNNIIIQTNIDVSIICDKFNNIDINDININNENKIIIIQKNIRGFLFRIKHLPLILYQIKKFLQTSSIKFSTQSKDGRMNSSIDEDEVIKLLKTKYNLKIKIPDEIRKWYNILIFNNLYGWLPVNIKTTTTLTSDNTGNFTICVHSYTNHNLDINKSYNNGDICSLSYA